MADSQIPRVTCTLTRGHPRLVEREKTPRVVTVLALEGDETFEADPETEKMLLEAMGQCDRGDTVPMTTLLSEMRDRE